MYIFTARRWHNQECVYSRTFPCLSVIWGSSYTINFTLLPCPASAQTRYSLWPHHRIRPFLRCHLSGLFLFARRFSPPGNCCARVLISRNADAILVVHSPQSCYENHASWNIYSECLGNGNAWDLSPPPKYTITTVTERMCDTAGPGRWILWVFDYG